jgi:ABC-type Fe3+ transport system permease subunit
MSGNMHAIPELDAKGYREFALTTGAIVAGLFGVAIPVIIWMVTDRESISFPSWPHPIASWPWIICVVLVAWGLIAPSSLKPVYKGWMKFGLFMGTYIMTPLIMSIVFYGMFMPIGLVMRLFGKDGLARKLDKAAESYRVESAKPPAKNLEKPF